MNPVRVLVADDHTLFRQGLRELLERKGNIRVVGEAANGQQAIDMARSLRPDVVLLDIQMPVVNGIEATRQILANQPQLPIVILTMYQQDRHVFDAIRAGAKAYLLKDAEASEVLNAIDTVVKGGAAINPAVAGRMLEEFRRQGPGLVDPDPITPRERDILALLVQGADNKAIAAQLHLSEKTVGNRLSEIFAKLGASNRTQAAMVAIQRGIVPAPDQTEDM